MLPFSPISEQAHIANYRESPCVFYKGPAGAGKTSAGIARLIEMLNSGVEGSSILILTPQRTLALPYHQLLLSSSAPAGGAVNVVTLGGLARRMVDLFWPLISAPAGFSMPNRPPHFLTLETAQYYMAHLVRPLLDQGLFSSVVIDRNRLYSQILDNLNKSAIIGFPFTQIGDRLAAAWVGEAGQTRVYADAQHCANLFRKFCLEHNLVDFSLQVELFSRFLWPSLLCREYLKSTYRHLIFDNIEEDTPVAHDLIKEWLPYLDTTLLIFDQDAGYRRFLGSDPLTALTLADFCSETVETFAAFNTPEPLSWFSQQVGDILEQPVSAPLSPQKKLAYHGDDFNLFFKFPNHALKFYPQMLDWAVDEIDQLIESGTPPGEIAVLSPYLPDALRFALSNRLEKSRIPFRSHRPSRSLRDEPATHCLLVLAQLAQPGWGIIPSKFDVAYALFQAIQGLDLIRAQLLAEIVYRRREGKVFLSPFDSINVDSQSRITYVLGARYEILRRWIETVASEGEIELDFLLSRLFGEVLSQPGFGFHATLDAGRVAANLIESVQKFRWAVEEHLLADSFSMGKEYIQMVEDGVIAAQYLQNWRSERENAVFLAPAHTFLMNNQSVDYQIWLDIGSPGWFERLNQPLTQPYVLSREWISGRVWTNADEYDSMRDSLYRLITGLTRRCRKGLIMGLSDLNEQGFENRGMLLKVVQRVLQQKRRDDAS